MEQDFYRDRMAQQHGLDVVTPDAPARDDVHRIIYEELCRGIIRDESRVIYQEIIQNLAAQGAQGIILGCTEIGLLITQPNSPLPVFDSTTLHAEMAADFVLQRSI